MTYKGKVQNGVIVLPPDVKFPEGSEVSVIAAEPPVEEDAFTAMVQSLAKPRDWPDDLSVNHDYYLHGNPHKQQPRQGRWIAGDLTTTDLSDEQAAQEATVLASMAAETVGLPSDLSANHDHYLYGLPKQ